MSTDIDAALMRRNDELNTQLNNARIGDINQGVGRNLKVLRVDGSPKGEGLPTVIVIEDTKTGKTARFIPEDL